MKDHELGSLMDRSTRDLPVDVEGLVAGGSARGRAALRRRRLGTALAAAGATAAVTVGIVAAPSLLAGGPVPREIVEAGPASASAGDPDATHGAVEQPARPDRPLRHAAAELPSIVMTALGAPVTSASVLEDAKHPLWDEAREKIVHFRWKGTLTTVMITPAHRSATCAELAAPDALPTLDGKAGAELPTRDPQECRVVDGLQVLVSPAYDLPVKAQGAQAWNHGYVVSVTSYNVPDGKNPDGSEDVPPVMDQPAIPMDRLIDLVTSEAWFA
ncbi:hypothetical protein [Nocardioides daejeonensis]|uniref:hypothetical protein n=1 Tax=Nocardioides daejeonensis TaxID=1046556 RepID=UPI000D74B03E|nr:hypothetical protein [Nocardioides daejeonensis]